MLLGTLTGFELTLIALAALSTAILSAVAGLGGGLVLLVLLLQFLPPVEAIPVHGAIQIVSNASRAFVLRARIRWGIVARHATLLLPGGLIGLQLAERLPRDMARALIGLFALVATWKPSILAPRVSGRFPRRGFFAVGAVHGAINMPLGATGPMIAPFFKSALEDRRDVVATFAAAQVIGHAVKIGLFGAAGFTFLDHAPVITAGAVGVWAGSLIGTRLLERVSERQFRWLFRGAVTAAAVPLLAQLLW